MLGVNLWGVIHGIRAFVPLLMQQDAGHIVNTASIAGLVAGPFMGPYNASKHAVVALSETLLHELAMIGRRTSTSRCSARAGSTPASARAPGTVRTEAEGGADLGAGLSLLQGVLARGMAPEAVAEQVLAAVRAERFWILTHDGEADSWVDAVNRRAQALIDRTDPAFGVPL